MARKTIFPLMISLLIAFVAISAQAQSEIPVVKAVLFYSPACPHCHKVMAEDLPPLKEKYGDQLQILEIDVTKPDGGQLYQRAIVTFNISEERRGVPALYVGSAHLVGANEIPAWFPGIIENGLQKGGLDWPPLPGLAPFIESISPNAPRELTMGDRFALDPVGNTIAVVVLVGLFVTLFLAWYAFANRITLSPWPEWVLPVLIVVGFMVAGYLSFIETTNTDAVCGPVGDCNAVQHSDYARLFGVMPIGWLGLAGYAGIGLAWGFKKYAAGKQAKHGTLAIWWMALLGTVFSIYLTFLEPFVIGATCAWCLSSAIIMALLLWASTPLALQAVARKHRVRSGHA